MVLKGFQWVETGNVWVWRGATELEQVPTEFYLVLLGFT